MPTNSLCKSNKFARLIPPIVTMGLAAMILGLSVGCQPLMKDRGTSATSATTLASGSSAQSYSVEVHSSWTGPKTAREAFNGPVPLQQVVEKSGAAKRHRNLDITVIRVAKETGQMLRLNAKYDPQSRTVEPQYDYDILANDHVIIKPSSSSPVDDLLKPLNQMTGG